MYSKQDAQVYIDAGADPYKSWYSMLYSWKINKIIKMKDRTLILGCSNLFGAYDENDKFDITNPLGIQIF